GVLHELLEDLAAFRLLEVESDGALVRGLREEPGAHALLVEDTVAARVAALVVVVRVLDLDDVGAQQGQLVRRERASQHVRDVDELHPLIWRKGSSRPGRTRPARRAILLFRTAPRRGGPRPATAGGAHCAGRASGRGPGGSKT